jgi:hypothetical protein
MHFNRDFGPAFKPSPNAALMVEKRHNYRWKTTSNSRFQIGGCNWKNFGNQLY